MLVSVVRRVGGATLDWFCFLTGWRAFLFSVGVGLERGSCGRNFNVGLLVVWCLSI